MAQYSDTFHCYTDDFIDRIESKLYTRDINYANIEKMTWPIGEEGLFDNIEDFKNEHLDWLEPVKMKRVLVQAGAGMGVWPILYTQYFDTIYTFEPSLMNRYVSEKNIKKYDVNNKITFFKKALGEHEDKGWTLDKSRQHYGEFQNHGAHRINLNENGSEKTTKIDSLNLQICDLIQLDIEGFEYQALVGAKETLERCKPVIIVETAHGGVSERQMNVMNYRKYWQGRMDAIYVHNSHK